MKKIMILSLTVFFLQGISTAQNTVTSLIEDKKFTKAMEANLKILDTASAASTYIMLANGFERIANTEKKYWQPYYYAALCYGFMASNVPDKNMIDALAIKAEGYLEKAKSLNDNSEISALQAMIINIKILVDPISRWQTYSIQSAALLQTAKEQDPLNPRPWLIEARTKLFTPAAMGGGPEAAKPLIERALIKYDNFKPENSISPNWGLVPTQKLMDKINSK
ncbi:MAG: hypothetical protein ACXWWC_06635 [Chitinophagaceae bacterium]